MDILFCHSRKLIGDRTAESRQSVVRVTELEFADDMVLFVGSRECLESVMEKFALEASRWV